MMPPKLFTLEQANAVIPVLQPILERLQPKVAEARAKHAELETLLEQAPSGNGHSVEREAKAAVLRAELEALLNEIEQGVEEMQSHGCEVKEVESGLLDFRSPRGDRVVYLCWRLGESEITAWHELDAGFRGRQPL